MIPSKIKHKGKLGSEKRKKDRAEETMQKQIKRRGAAGVAGQ